MSRLLNFSLDCSLHALENTFYKCLRHVDKYQHLSRETPQSSKTTALASIIDQYKKDLSDQMPTLLEMSRKIESLTKVIGAGSLFYYVLGTVTASAAANVYLSSDEQEETRAVRWSNCTLVLTSTVAFVAALGRQSLCGVAITLCAVFGSVYFRSLNLNPPDQVVTTQQNGAHPITRQEKAAGALIPMIVLSGLFAYWGYQQETIAALLFLEKSHKRASITPQT